MEELEGRRDCCRDTMYEKKIKLQITNKDFIKKKIVTTEKKFSAVFLYLI